MIKREQYISKIRSFYDSDLIKVITGIRRSGKSVILQTIMEELKAKTDNIIYLNFENSSDFNKVYSVETLINYVNNNRKEGKCYIFLDEIQEIDNWQKAVKDLRLHNNSIFVTGSNSKLLSKEFLTLLSGRFVSFRIRPFVYKEILEYDKEYGANNSIDDYLVWGGFPGRLSLNNLEANKEYLSSLENTIVINDLIARYKIKKVTAFKNIVNYLLKSNSRIYSARSIYNYLKNEYQDITLSFVLKCIEYLKEAYIIDEINQYSLKAKKELVFYGKIYDADVAFNSLRVFDNRYDLDHNLENIVYNELLYRGYELKVFSTDKDKEIDFIANKNGKTYYVQVAYSVVDKKAYDREIGAFASIDNLNEKILITNDILDYSTSTIRHIKLKDFLLMDEF
jgi:predicted AAA+ superfamily ATPase